jgi:amino acid transporter
LQEEVIDSFQSFDRDKMDSKTGEKVDVSERSTNSDPVVEFGEVYDYPNEVGGHHGELKRTFKARHIQMICLGGCIGSGIFISTGKVGRMTR